MPQVERLRQVLRKLGGPRALTAAGTDGEGGRAQRLGKPANSEESQVCRHHCHSPTEALYSRLRDADSGWRDTADSAGLNQISMEASRMRFTKLSQFLIVFGIAACSAAAQPIASAEPPPVNFIEQGWSAD